ncbi:MAG: 7TM domain-containing protein [Bacteroidota bacterium]
MNVARLISFAFILITIGVISVKFISWEYTFKNILPQKKYEVNIDISSRGFSQPVNISTYLPISDNRQTISYETNNSPSLNFLVEQTKSGRVGTWNTMNGNGMLPIRYSFEFIGRAIKYNIDSTLIIPKTYPPSFNEYLKTTKNIQVKHPQINRIFQEEVGDNDQILEVLANIQSYTNSLKSRPFKGVTDALTAARLGEASCNGKSRLFIALARSANIPSRLVGGIILESGTKKTSHQWVEAYIGNEWVPFDPLNNHFAFLPHNYLSMYRGDKFLFSHTKNINFEYKFNVKSRLSPNPLLQQELKSHPFNAYQLWKLFESIGIPIGLLKIVLLLPLGALIVAIFRNVIGMQTFGVFLPALIAVASRETGLFWGLIAFMIVIGVVSLVHFPLEKWGILYTPKLVIMLVAVVILFLIISYLSIELNISSLAYIALFPIVILTISAERFARTISEEGFVQALLITLQTLIVSSVAYFAMNSDSMEAFFLAFPELFLVIIGLNLLLGQWIGIRVIEFIRFRVLLR